MTSKTTRNARGGGNIRRRSDGRWEARYTLGTDPKTGKQIQKSVYGKTQKEVRQKLAKITAEIDDGIYVMPTSMTVGQWLDTWLQDYTANVKPATLGAYSQHVRVNIKPHLGHIRLSKLEPYMVQRVYKMFTEEKGLSPKSVKNIHGVFHRALAQAKQLGYLRTNPLDSVILPRVEKYKIQTMEDADMAAFLQVIQGDWYENILFIAAFTGLRQGELLGLTWDCVDFENNTLLINKQHNKSKGESEYKFGSLKNDSVRVLTAAEAVMDVLMRQKRLQNQWAQNAGELWNNEDNLVFTTETGRYVNNKTLYLNFKRIARSIGLPNLRFHDLRHSYAVNSLRAGDDIKTVQENLGHATASFTLSTYAHATPGMKRESAKRMEDYIHSLQSGG